MSNITNRPLGSEIGQEADNGRYVVILMQALMAVKSIQVSS